MREDFRFITRFSWKLEGFIFTDVLTNCSWLFSQLPWEPVQIHTFPHKSKEKMVIFAEKYCAGYLRDQNHYRPKQACKRAITIICLAEKYYKKKSAGQFFFSWSNFRKIWKSRIFEKKIKIFVNSKFSKFQNFRKFCFFSWNFEKSEKNQDFFENIFWSDFFLKFISLSRRIVMKRF